MIIQSTREATREELIQRIKDLEEENKYLRDENSIYRNETISKSIIRNKINKLENEFYFFAGREHAEWQDGEFDGDVCDDLALQIKVLKELLKN